MGGVCSRKNKGQVEENYQDQKTNSKTADDLKFDKSSFILQSEPFKDHYQIGQSMGSGTYGEVRKCKNIRSQVVRAVKILKRHNLNDFELQRFTHEVEILKRLDHPNIIKINEFYDDNERFYLVTEICTGGELYDQIAIMGNIQEKDTAIIIQQVIAAIAYSHRQNVVHRDLKPENILIDQKGNLTIKLSDFGSAAIYCQNEDDDKQNKKMRQTVGTAYYMAPEVLTSEYDEKCDLWSIGVIIYTMLAGIPPFQGKNELEIVKAIKSGIYHLEIPELEHVSMDCKNLISQLLCYDPRERISAENALRHRWIKKYDQSEQDHEITMQALKSLCNFNTQQKLQEAVITFIVGQLASKEDMIDLQKAFKVLDTDNDGMLNRAELTVGLGKLLQDGAADEVERIFNKVDIDGSGFIDYSEWVVATINKEKLLTRDKLQAAFNLFDKDGGGSISAHEVKDVLCSGQNLDDEVWTKVVSEADNDGNGEIDFDEFCNMMQKMLNYDEEDEAEIEDAMSAKHLNLNIQTSNGQRQNNENQSDEIFDKLNGNQQKQRSNLATINEI